MSKRKLKNSFFSKRLKIKQNTAEIGTDFYTIFQVGVNFFQREKLVSRLARSQSWLCPIKMRNPTRFT